MTVRKPGSLKDITSSSTESNVSDSPSASRREICMRTAVLLSPLCKSYMTLLCRDVQGISSNEVARRTGRVGKALQIMLLTIYFDDG